MRNQNTQPYAGPFPRPRHSHRCQQCNDAVYCYKGKCTRPQSIELCSECAWKQSHRPAAAPAYKPIMCSGCGQVPALCGVGNKGYCATCMNPADVAAQIFKPAAAAAPVAVATAAAPAAAAFPGVQLSLFGGGQ